MEHRDVTKLGFFNILLLPWHWVSASHSKHSKSNKSLRFLTEIPWNLIAYQVECSYSGWPYLYTSTRTDRIYIKNFPRSNTKSRFYNFNLGFEVLIFLDSSFFRPLHSYISVVQFHFIYMLHFVNKIFNIEELFCLFENSSVAELFILKNERS